MKIIINISRREALHLRSPHTFYDSCGEADDVLRKVQKEIDKKVPKYTPRLTKEEKVFLKRIKKKEKSK